ncbi:MAG: glycosyltransferase [Patescibacteria group bacterium]
MNAPRLKTAPPKRTAVLHLVGELDLGAQARETVDLAIQTHRAGWRPLVASAGGALVMEAQRAAVRHTTLPLKTKSAFIGWRNRAHIEKLIENEKPVLIHAHGFDVVGLATKLAVRTRLPFLIDLTEPSPVTPARRKILQTAASRGARFRVPSSYMAEHLRNDLKIQTDFLYHISPGVDLQWYDAVRVTPERINQLYKLWRLPEQSTVIVMATPFATGYGHKMFLEALITLKNRDIYAILIGDDRAAPGTRAIIEDFIVANGLEGKVIMPEACTDWPAACWLSSLVIANNAVPRGQGPELLAAQAIGRPVIVTDCGANTEMVKDGETAWVIPKENSDTLIAALNESLAMSAARRIDLALRTRDFVNTFFPMEVWRDSIFELYDAMLAQPMIQAAA